MGIDRGFDSTKAPQTTKLAHISLHLATSTPEETRMFSCFLDRTDGHYKV